MAGATASIPHESGLLQTMMVGNNIEDLVATTTEEDQKFMIHRFPSDLSRIGRERGYIGPRTVALGPYYHGVPELQAMEAVKRTVAEHFFLGLAESQEASYEKFKPIARKARNCYADADALSGIIDDKFSEMMFVDGCFLVQFFVTVLGGSGAEIYPIVFRPRYLCIMRDMMLLENQIPWSVMEFFMELKELTMEEILRFILLPYLHGTLASEPLVTELDKAYKPSHLLCLIQFYEASGEPVMQLASPFPGNPSGYTSAAELAEIGIKLEASKTKQFSDMDIKKGHFFAKLALAPLNMGTTIACWLVNMAAFEMCTETENLPICSYLGFLSNMMNKEEDVHKLRAEHVVRGWSDKETLEFFKDLAQDLCTGYALLRISMGLEAYKHKRRVWIAIYRFVYNNIKTIAAVLSVIGVLVGIFKTLLSLKQHLQ